MSQNPEPNTITTAQACERLGITRQRLHQLAKRFSAIHVGHSAWSVEAIERLYQARQMQRQMQAAAKAAAAELMEGG